VRTVVGVNVYQEPKGPLDVFAVDPAMEAAQVAAVRAVRAARGSVAGVLADVADAARGQENVIPACTAAVRARATIGEVVAVLRGVYGSWQPSGTF
jgi:methylmalonyl-CoA mutase N-terminal domain/subunit